MKVWRISKLRHAATAYSGEGPCLALGRWNPAGIPMVYTSSSLSLAVVEVFVHLDAAADRCGLGRIGPITRNAVPSANNTTVRRADTCLEP